MKAFQQEELDDFLKFLLIRIGGFGMKVKVIMIPFKKLNVISVDETIENALNIIDENRLLSMPVVDGKQFIGVLSKQHIFETYFREYEGTKEEFVAQKVKVMMKTKISTVDPDLTIEEAAAHFISSKVRFLPITNQENELLGIVTQQAIFKEYQKLFGSDFDQLVVYTYDFKGVLAKMSEVIAKAGGNIKNIVQINTETMGLQEIFVRVECKDFHAVVKALEKHKFDVRL